MIICETEEEEWIWKMQVKKVIWRSGGWVKSCLKWTHGPWVGERLHCLKISVYVGSGLETDRHSIYVGESVLSQYNCSLINVGRRRSRIQIDRIENCSGKEGVRNTCHSRNWPRYHQRLRLEEGVQLKLLPEFLTGKVTLDSDDRHGRSSWRGLLGWNRIQQLLWSGEMRPSY